MRQALIIETPLGTTQVHLPSNVLQEIDAFQIGHEAETEAGGIFIGAYRGNHIEIVGCTKPMPRDVRRRHLFDRKDPGHQAAALRAWRESSETLTYVGEWHTHPEAAPSPSGRDFKTWHSILGKSAKNPVFFFIRGTISHFAMIGVSNTLVIAASRAEC